MGTASLDILDALAGTPTGRPGGGGSPPLPRRADAAPWIVVLARPGEPRHLAHGRLRRREFVERQGLFAGDDRDAADEDPRTRTLLALDAREAGGGRVLGGVRLHPEAAEIGWWRGSRLVVDDGAGALRGRIGAALVRAACAQALDLGALRFDAHVQLARTEFFARLGWQHGPEVAVAGRPHRLMHHDLGRFRELAAGTKGALGALLGPVLPRDGWRGDDGVPIPATDVVACTDAILPAMVAEDPAWAGWCGMLVTAHDLSAMGAAFAGALDALAAPDAAHAERVLRGVRAASRALDLPVLGGHTTLGAPASLAVSGFGRTATPVPAGGGRIGDAVHLTADLAGGWRPGYRERQWDSSSVRRAEELAPMLSAVARARPAAAKDVSMAGTVGTLGMLAEASGCGAELEPAAVPRPPDASLAAWLTCFPGFAMLSADRPGRPGLDAGAAASVRCGSLVAEPGVWLRWPDGLRTPVLDPAVSGLGAARAAEPETSGQATGRGAARGDGGRRG